MPFLSPSQHRQSTEWNNRTVFHYTYSFVIFVKSKSRECLALITIIIWIHYVAAPVGWGYKALSAVVRPSACPVPDPKSKMEGYRNLKIGMKEAHDTDDPWPHLEVERSKVKVSKPINNEAKNAPYLPKEETDELQTWYRDAGRWLASPNVRWRRRSKVKVIRSCHVISLMHVCP